MLHLKVAVCDDDTIYMKDLTARLERYMMANDTDISCQTYTDGRKLLNAYDTNERFHVLFLDMEMPGIDGMTLARNIRQFDRHVYIIFVSNYPRYMQESFLVHPFYYLVKPLTDQVFVQAMDDIISTIENEHQFITLIHTDETAETVRLDDILYMEVSDGKRRLLNVHFRDHSLLTKGTLKDWVNKLKEYDFILCHRGILINMSKIHYFKSGQVILTNGASLPVSRTMEKKLKNLFSDNIVRLKKL